MLAWASESGSQNFGDEAGRCVHGAYNYMESLTPAQASLQTAPAMLAWAGESGDQLIGGEAGSCIHGSCYSMYQC